MSKVDRDVQRKLRALRRAEQIGCISKAVGILGLAGRVFIAGEQPSGGRGKPAW